MARFTRAGLPAGDATELAALLEHCGREADKGVRVRVLGTLLVLAPDDDIAALCALVVLRPVLARMAYLLAGRGMDREDAEAEVVAVAIAVLKGGPESHEERPLGSVVDAIWCVVRRSAGLRRQSLPVVALTEDFDRAAPEIDPLGRCPALLAAAVARGVLTPRAAVVIAQSRMDERPLDEIAASLARPYAAVRLERWRAEAALRSFALSYGAEESE